MKATFVPRRPLLRAPLTGASARDVAAAYVASDDADALEQLRAAAAGMGPEGVSVMAVRSLPCRPATTVKGLSA